MAGKKGAIHRPWLDRFIEKVKIGEGCWEWQAATTADGYGTFRTASGQGMELAHRVMFRIVHGRDPDPDKELRHTCTNPPCTKPDHVVEATHIENMSDVVWERSGKRNGRYIHGRRSHAVRVLDRKPKGTPRRAAA